MFADRLFAFFSTRILGFVDIYSSSCDGNSSDIRIIEFNDTLDLDHYLNPIALILCYFVVALTSRVLLGPKVTPAPPGPGEGCRPGSDPLRTCIAVYITNPIVKIIERNFSHISLSLAIRIVANHGIKISRNHSRSEARRVEIIHDRAILAAREWHREGKRSAPGLVPNGPQEHSAQDIRDE